MRQVIKIRKMDKEDVQEQEELWTSQTRHRHGVGAAMFAPRRNRKPSSIRRQLHALTIGIGHNGGPPLSDVWLEYTWRKARRGLEDTGQADPGPASGPGRSAGDDVPGVRSRILERGRILGNRTVTR